MRAILDRSADLVAWAAARIPELHGQGFPDATQAIGVARANGSVAGVVCFHSWEPWNGTIEVSAVSEDARWLMAREAWALMFHYAFVTCDCQKVWSRTPARNARALRFLRALGFEREAVLKRHFGDDDAVISCKFRERHEQTQSARAA